VIVDQLQVFSEDGPACPCCKSVWTLDEAYYFNESGYQLTCDDCGITFNVEAHASWSFTSTVPPEELVNSIGQLQKKNEELREQLEAALQAKADLMRAQARNILTGVPPTQGGGGGWGDDPGG
jgi:predicted amidophosphoribosyltransferase